MNSNKNLTRWKWLCYLQSLFGLETFIAPVLIIFYTGYAGFSFSQYAILMSYTFIFSWAFQLPTGVIADKFGKKQALIFGNIIYVFAMTSLVVYGNAIPIILTSALFSFGSALSTGAFQAMMYSTYAAEGKVGEFNAVNARGNSLALLGGAIGAALGGILATMSLALPMIIDIIVLCLITVILFIWLEPPLDERVVQKITIRIITLDAINAALKSTKLFTSIFVTAMAFAGVRTGFNLYQPLLTNTGLPLSQLGGIFGGFSLFSAGIAYAYSKVGGKILDGPIVLILIVLAFVVSTIFIVSEPTVVGIICAILCHQIVRAVYPPFSAYLININIAPNSASRTTILSLAALLRSISAAAFSYGLAIAATRFSDRYMFGAINLVSAASVLAFGLWSLHAGRSKKSIAASSGS
jgi:MFS family permease